MPNQTYDLMLVVSAEADASRRAEIAAEADALIARGGGSISSRTEWGERPLAFDIDHEATGDYRIVRFEAPGASLEAISRQLNITDQLLRHRIIKAVPGAPDEVAASSPPAESAVPPASAATTAPSAPAPTVGSDAPAPTAAAEGEPAAPAEVADPSADAPAESGD